MCYIGMDLFMHIFPVFIQKDFYTFNLILCDIQILPNFNQDIVMCGKF